MEVSRAWQCKDVVVVPAVIGALGAVTTECEEEIQKIARAAKRGIAGDDKDS